MKLPRRFILLIFIVSITNIVNATIVTKDVALQKALMLFSCDNKAASIDTFSVLGKAEMYKVVTDKGWALLSSETSITPILAYSYEGDFPSVDDMPDGMKWLFSYYEEAIQQARLRQDELKKVDKEILSTSKMIINK